MAIANLLLINPRACSRRAIRLPLSLLALGAVLEGRQRYRILDGNVETRLTAAVLAALDREPRSAVGMTVMPGPQVVSAIALSRAIRARHPRVPIIWGGYFPTLYPAAALNAPYVDYAVRGQGEETLLELLRALPDAGSPGARAAAADPDAIRAIRGLSWREEGAAGHAPERRPVAPDRFPPLPYERLDDVAQYLRPSFMGRRTAVHQAAIGCRYRCTFCGVVSMWNGKTLLPGAARLLAAGRELRERWGADALQLYDHNFFDREDTAVPMLDALERLGLPWWCYARTDTLAGFSSATWRRIERSGLRMAYLGAETSSDEVLGTMRKGTRVEHTLETARLCRAHGVVPEFSFVLGGPEDPEGEIERTFRFIRRLKRLHPECEVVLYFYSPTPQRSPSAGKSDAGVRLPLLERYGPQGPPLPTTPEEWTEKRWLDYVCHRDAPWLSARVRRRVRDFQTVLGCRFPTVQDAALPFWGSVLLRSLASWRYRTGIYRNPRELRAVADWLALRQPQHESI